MLRCENTADFLAALPRLVGFTASHSLFVVLFAGSRAGSAIRIDLPESERPADTARYLDALCGQLAALRASHGDGAPAVVISSATRFSEAGGHPWRRLALRLERRLAAEGHTVRELCCIAPDGWVSYLDPAAPPLGRPLTEIAESPLSGIEEVPDLGRLGALPAPTAAERQAVADALAAANTLTAGLAGENTPPSTDTAANGAAESCAVGLLRRTDAAPPKLIARAIIELNSERGWLAVFDEFVGCAEAVAGREPSAPHRRRAGRPGGGRSRGPGSARAAATALARSCDRLAHWAALSPPPLRAAVLAASAMAWWLRGLQSVAQRQIAEALRISPDDRTALIVARVFGDAHFPLPQPREAARTLWEDSSAFDTPRARG